MSTANTSAYDPASLAAPPPEWHPRQDHGHIVQFYTSDDFLLNTLSGYFETTLVSGDVGLVIGTAVHREGLARRLRARGLDLPRLIARGRYITLDAAATLAKFVHNGIPDPVRFHQVMGDVLARARAAAESVTPRVAAFGEMVALLWGQEKFDAAVRLEQLWNELATIHPFSLHCAYPISGFKRSEQSELFLKVCAEHTEVIPVESYSALESDEERLRVVSELQQKAHALEAEIEERKRVEHALRESEARLQNAKQHLESLVEQRTVALRRLSTRILILQDSERRRIARELHDGLGQYLAAAKINLDVLLGTEELSANEQLADADSLVAQAVAEIRTISYLLHPPMLDETGLESAVRWYLDGFSQRSGIQVKLSASENPERLPDTVELALFRVLQESLTNVHRHAGATEAEVVIGRDAEAVVLEIKDNGNGLPAETLARFQDNGSGSGVGLTGMRERVRELGGEIVLESDGNGTQVHICIPICES